MARLRRPLRPSPALFGPKANLVRSLDVSSVGGTPKRSFRGVLKGFFANGFLARAFSGPARSSLGGRPRGIVVVGHGTADPVGAAETRQVADLVADMMPDVAVELGFLEVIGPSIGEALERLAARGCAEVVAAPLLLFTAGHARHDVPEAVRDGAARVGVVVSQADALGCHPSILELARQRRREALATLAPVSADETLLLMVGRGSSDPTAFRQLHDFTVASCRGESADADREDPAGQLMPRIQLGFVAAARPSLPEAIAQAVAGVDAAGDGRKGAVVRRVVVQPHLLFRGHVEEQVTAAVERARLEHPGIEWVQVRRLGADRLVARALVDRATIVS